ncbi:MAG TPA: tetratricopeptide repeat protein [Armatimonadota bacterium]|nr:tetratricopeptide repeat protein [Armatimonadota bacterium]
MSDRRLEAAQFYEEARSRRAEGNWTGAFARYRRVLEITDELNDPRWKAEVLAELGRMYQEACDLTEARRWYGAALEQFAALDIPAESGALLYRLAQVEHLAGDLDAAERLYEEAMRGCAAAGDLAGEGLALAGLGSVFWDRRQEPEGLRLAVRGLQRVRQAGSPEADALLERIRSWRASTGPVRYRGIVQQVVEDPELRRELM